MSDTTENKITLLLIRHGKTKGNLEGRYIGCRSDEELLKESVEDLKRQAESMKSLLSVVEAVYISPMLRCRQTAQILFPNQQFSVINDLREMDFGAFEGYNYKELNGDPRYQHWIDTGGAGAFPEGESREEFISRIVNAAKPVMQQIHSKAAMVVHGGTIMALMSEIINGEYFSFQVKNGEGFCLQYRLNEEHDIYDLSFDRIPGRFYS